MKKSSKISISSARFANVLFSDGSLVFSFMKRIEKKQPIVAPTDIKRYFMTLEESGQLCLLSCIFGKNRDIFFPKFEKHEHLETFDQLAIKYLEYNGLKVFKCKTENDAREMAFNNKNGNYYPCYFSNSETTGEKKVEEFFTKSENFAENFTKIAKTSQIVCKFQNFEIA